MLYSASFIVRKIKKDRSYYTFLRTYTEEAFEIKGKSKGVKYSALQRYKKYLGSYSVPLEIEEHPFQKENGIMHAFEKIS